MVGRSTSANRVSSGRLSDGSGIDCWRCAQLVENSSSGRANRTSGFLRVIGDRMDNDSLDVGLPRSVALLNTGVDLSSRSLVSEHDGRISRFAGDFVALDD